MVQRPHTARFMPGVWVFPGGVVDDTDARPPAAFAPIDDSSDWKVAAARELMEETGIWLTSTGTHTLPIVSHVFDAVAESSHRIDLDQLIYFSNWITPSVFPIRFDTRFYFAVSTVGEAAAFNPDELIGATWVSPIDALQREDADDWAIAFPTRRVLELLASEPSAAGLADRLTSMDIVPPIQPRLLVGAEEARIVLPDDPDFAAAGAQQDDPTILERLADVVASGARVPVEFKKRT
ncbi:MAG: NUDIX hydrolase [Actinomycetia bacterium]|nr:NUDIX hydrolase [Actinomycetes bacterium]